MPEISRLEEMGNVSVLKPEGLKEAHQSLVGLGSLGGHILEGNLPEDHIRADHPFCEVVVRRQARDLEEGENLPVIFEESLREAFPMRVRKRLTGKMQESVFHESRSSVKNPRRKPSPFLIQSIGIREDAFEFDPGRLILGRRVPDVFDFPLEMDQTALPPLSRLVVGGKEITHGDSLEIRSENLSGDFPSPAPSDPVEGEFPIHKDPEPMKDSRDFPAGFIPVDPGGLPNRLEDEFFLDFEPLGKALERLGESRVRDFESTKLFEKNPDLGIRKAVVVFEQDRLHEDIGTEIPIRDFFQGVRRSLLLSTIRAPVAVADEFRGLHLGRDNILLDMFFLVCHKLSQGGLAAIRTPFQGLMDGVVDEFGFVSGDAGVSYGPSEFLPTLLEFSLEGRGFQGLRPLVLFQSLHFLLKLLDLLPETEDFFDELFFGFLYEEEAVTRKAGCLKHSDFNFGLDRENLKGLIRTR